ncbi:MAG: hypothetical protein AAB131_11820 [Actinomycetota bacterium]
MAQSDDQYMVRYARREDWDCLMWAWNELPEVQQRWGGPSPWRQSAGGEKRYIHREAEAHEIMLRHGAVITPGSRKKWHFTRPGRQV